MLNAFNRLAKALLDRPTDDLNWFEVIAWWELRRIPYNLVLLLAGVFNIAISLFILYSSGSEGGDLGDPLLGVWAYAFMANVCYTGGWILELLLRLLKAGDAAETGRKLYKIGFIFSFGLTLFGV
jgi:hypothetical protein